MRKKHLLFSVAGMSPAVITETLFGLWEKQGVTGGEIHILTTSYGQKSMQVLLGESGQVAAFNHLYGTNWAIYPEWIEALTGPPHSQPLTDLRTSADNESAANGIVERVREWTQQFDLSFLVSQFQVISITYHLGRDINILSTVINCAFFWNPRFHYGLLIFNTERAFAF